MQMIASLDLVSVLEMSGHHVDLGILMEGLQIPQAVSRFELADDSLNLSNGGRAHPISGLDRFSRLGIFRRAGLGVFRRAGLCGLRQLPARGNTGIAEFVGFSRRRGGEGRRRSDRQGE